MRSSCRIIASAGRRIDPPNAKKRRFPAEREAEVAAKVREVLESLKPDLTISSAACGADILLLEVAQNLGIESRVILPFDKREFRRRSVADCGSDWGSRFDSLIADGSPIDKSLVVLSPNLPSSDAEADIAYTSVTDAIIQAASESAGCDNPCIAMGLLVWDGIVKDERDQTALFRNHAAKRGWKIVEVKTL